MWQETAAAADSKDSRRREGRKEKGNAPRASVHIDLDVYSEFLDGTLVLVPPRPPAGAAAAGMGSL